MTKNGTCFFLNIYIYISFSTKEFFQLNRMIVRIKQTEFFLQEGTGSYKKKPPEHWTKRMGNKNVQSRPQRGGVTLSTVGVDIGDWVYEKKVRGQSYGPVTFRSHYLPLIFPSSFPTLEDSFEFLRYS